MTAMKDVTAIGMTTIGASTAIVGEATMTVTTAGSFEIATTVVSAEIATIAGLTAMTAASMPHRSTTTDRGTMRRSIMGRGTVSSASSTATTGRGTAIAGAVTIEAVRSSSTFKRTV